VKVAQVWRSAVQQISRNKLFALYQGTTLVVP